MSGHTTRAGAPRARLRVLYSFPHSIGLPGIGTTAWYQVQSLIDEGHALSLWCTKEARPLRGVESVRQTLVFGGVRLPHRALGVDRAYAYHDWRVARALPRLAGSLDLVHCWPSGSLATLGVAHTLGIPTFLERPHAHTRFAYEVAAEESRRTGVPLERTHYAAWNAKRLAREEREFALADHLLCPSEFVARTFRERGFADEKLSRHRYGFDPARFRVSDVSERAGAEARQPLRVAYVGLCTPHKGVHYALEAWQRSGVGERGGCFEICGRVEPRYRPVIGRWLAHRGVVERGFVSDPGAVMRECDALVLASIAEGSALVTYEARASGCVLLVSDASGAPCTHAKDALVHRVGDVATLASHFRMLDEDRALLARLRAESLAGVPDLTWASAARTLAEVYRDALARRRS